MCKCSMRLEKGLPARHQGVSFCKLQFSRASGLSTEVMLSLPLISNQTLAENCKMEQKAEVV